MAASLDRFSCGVTLTVPDEVGDCKACGSQIYDYELDKCESCDARIHHSCMAECDECGEIGCKACLIENEEGLLLCEECKNKEESGGNHADK